MSVLDKNNYLKNTILQASQEQLHLMLYDGAIRFALQGRDAILRKDFEQTYEKLTRAQNILLEMQTALRPEVNRELCERMSGLYAFVYRKLVDASMNRDPSQVDDALKILRHQRETWAILVEKINTERGHAEGSAEAAPVPAGSLSVEG
jgi:flagellar secretion chaperone FliS